MANTEAGDDVLYAWLTDLLPVPERLENHLALLAEWHTLYSAITLCK